MARKEGGPRGAFIQRDKKSYAIVPRTPMGMVTPEILEAIARIARDNDVTALKITTAQRIALIGIEPDRIDQIWDDLGLSVGQAVEACVHYVQACPGTTFCKFGVADSLSLGERMETLFVGRELPAKAKLGVSGCHFNCAEGWVRDLGAFGRKRGWSVTFGGNAGRKPRIGDLIAEGLSDEEVLSLTARCLDYFTANAKRRERSARFIDRIGLDTFKRAVLDD